MTKSIESMRRFLEDEEGLLKGAKSSIISRSEVVKEEFSKVLNERSYGT